MRLFGGSCTTNGVAWSCPRTGINYEFPQEYASQKASQVGATYLRSRFRCFELLVYELAGDTMGISRDVFRANGGTPVEQESPHASDQN
jgi:hypothetical protein